MQLRPYQVATDPNVKAVADGADTAGGFGLTALLERPTAYRDADGVGGLAAAGTLVGCSPALNRAARRTWTDSLAVLICVLAKIINRRRATTRRWVDPAPARSPVVKAPHVEAAVRRVRTGPAASRPAPARPGCAR